MTQLKLNAQWTNDCQGKKDYDGEILAVSTRYWPAGGGMLVFDTAEPEKGLHTLDRPDIKPSATSSLVINHGDGDYLDLVEAEFEADTFEEVKVQVEAWAQAQMDRAIAALRKEFPEPEAST